MKTAQEWPSRGLLCDTYGPALSKQVWAGDIDSGVITTEAVIRALGEDEVTPGGRQSKTGFQLHSKVPESWTICMR